MGKAKLTKTQEQELARTIFDAMPEAEEMSVLGLLQYGSSMLLKEAVAEEITRYLGRGFYQHLKGGQEFKGSRNGSRRTTVDTPIGQVSYDRPLVAYAPDFESKFHTPYMRRPKAFANAIADMHVNGVSHRGVKRALKSVTGENIRLSKSTISRITKRLVEEFKLWQKRDLSNLPVKYLLLDATRLKMRMDSSAKQPVMITYAVLEDGSMETISIAVKNSESNGAWESFIADLKRRGLKDPLLTISDGNDGVIAAIEKYFQTGWRQRCVKHKTDNVLECVPLEKQEDVRTDINRIFYGATSLEQAKIAVQDFTLKYRKLYPSAVACLHRDLDQCLTFYLFPLSHWKRIRTSHCLERLNLEIKRRLKSVGRHPDEDGCLALIYRVCMQYQQKKYGFKADDLVHALWKKLREQKIEMIKQLELDLEAA